MKLYIRCTSCKKELTLKSSANTRPDLQMEKGAAEFQVNCMHCGKLFKAHVNDLRAESNVSVTLYSLLATVIIMVVLWFFLGIISTIFFIIPLLVWYAQKQAAKAFNSYLIRRR